MKEGIAYRPLSDMESNGVYFERDEVIVVDEEDVCQYSGLPSVKSYELIINNRQDCQ